MGTRNDLTGGNRTSLKAQRVMCPTVALVAVLLLVPTSARSAPQQKIYKLSDYGAVCNGQHDDTSSFAAAAADASRGCVQVDNDEWYQAILEFPPRGSCRFKSPISIDASCVALNTNGAVLRFPQSSGITFTSSHPATPYGDNLAVKEKLHVVGPGNSSNSGTYGVMLKAANLAFDSLDVHGFNYGVQIGDSTYMISMYHPNLWGNGVGLYCPGGSNSGENIATFGGAIFNNAVGIDNQGCDIVLSSTSLDYNSVTAVKDAVNPNNGAATGSVTLLGVNVEFGVISGPVFQLGINGTGSNCNGFAFIEVEGGKIHATQFPTPNSVALVDNDTCGNKGPKSGGWVIIRDAWVDGIIPSGKCVAGTETGNCVIGNNAQQVKLIELRNSSGQWFSWNN